MGRKPTWTREKIINAYKKKCKEKGREIKTQEFWELGLPVSNALYRVFKSVHELRYACGMLTDAEYEEKKKHETTRTYEEDFCQDCVEDPEECGNSVNECIAAGKLYLKGAKEGEE